MKYAILVVVLFTVIYYAFHPGVEAPTFNDVFAFGYDVTIRPLEVFASVKDGLAAFIENLVAWFKSLFGV